MGSSSQLYTMGLILSLSSRKTNLECDIESSAARYAHGMIQTTVKQVVGRTASLADSLESRSTSGSTLSNDRIVGSGFLFLADDDDGWSRIRCGLAHCGAFNARPFPAWTPASQSARSMLLSKDNLSQQVMS